MSVLKELGKHWDTDKYNANSHLIYLKEHRYKGAYLYKNNHCCCNLKHMQYYHWTKEYILWIYKFMLY